MRKAKIQKWGSRCPIQLIKKTKNWVWVCETDLNFNSVFITVQSAAIPDESFWMPWKITLLFEENYASVDGALLDQYLRMCLNTLEGSQELFQQQFAKHWIKTSRINSNICKHKVQSSTHCEWSISAAICFIKRFKLHWKFQTCPTKPLSFVALFSFIECSTVATAHTSRFSKHTSRLATATSRITTQ